MLHEDLTDKILAAACEVRKRLTPGYLESIYEKALIIELTEQGLNVESQVPIQVDYKGINIGDFKIDLLVDDKIIVNNISLPVSNHKNAPKLHAWYEGKSITLQTSNKSFNTKNNTADKLFGLCECGYTLESHANYSEKFVYNPENASMVKNYAAGEKNIGVIANKEYLIEQAKKLWDKDLLNKLVVDNTNEECPVVAQYNENDEVWYVIQTANPNTDGVFPLAIIKSNGDVVLTALY